MFTNHIKAREYNVLWILGNMKLSIMKNIVIMIVSYLNNGRNGHKNHQMSLQNKENPLTRKGKDKKPIKKYNKNWHKLYKIVYLFILV
jgi:hypothetical protein